MFTIASLLDRKANAQTENYWALLERECKLSEIRTIPFPHFSWFTAKDICCPDFVDKLEKISKDFRTFTVRTSGLGIFTGESPILYIPLIKTRHMQDYHQIIWTHLSPCLHEVNEHYAPDVWVPHITIAYGDVSPDRLACAIENLASKDLSTIIEIDNIAFLSRIEEEAKIECVFKLD